MSDEEVVPAKSRRRSKRNVSVESEHDTDEGIETESQSTISSRRSSIASLNASKTENKKRKGRGKYKRPKLYEYVNHIKEDHGGTIFGIHLHQKNTNGENYLFATVGKNQVSIYEVSKTGKVKLLQSYCDPDSKEHFYTSAWTTDYKGICYLAVAGLNGIIRVINPYLMRCVKHYVGHGHAINELMFHTLDPNILISASKDQSIRMWNIKTDLCVAILAGSEGHRAEVLSVDINMRGEYLTSAGMDHSLKIWNIGKKEVKEAIGLSYDFRTGKKPFPTLIEDSAEFTTRDIHKNYVDCVRWIGDCILSKSCENQIVLWKPGRFCDKKVDYAKTKFFSIIHIFELKDCELWYMRFSLDFLKKTLALGNTSGKIYVWNLDVDQPENIKHTILTHQKCSSAIRQTQLSSTGSLLLAACDDGTIWIWQRHNS